MTGRPPTQPFWMSVTSSRLALAALVVANLLPLFGVLFWGWDLGLIMILYWLENGVIGLYTLAKLFTHMPSGAESPALEHAGKLFLMPFFAFHYGMFWAVHGVFVLLFFGGGFGAGIPMPTAMPGYVLELAGRDGALMLGLLALVASHGVSFASNYLGRGEYRRGTLQEKMMQPYGRVVALHLTLLLGGFASFMLGEPVGALLLLIALKIVLDVRAHLREHRETLAPTPA
jgi:hypothetical protein